MRASLPLRVLFSVLVLTAMLGAALVLNTAAENPEDSNGSTVAGLPTDIGVEGNLLDADGAPSGVVVAAPSAPVTGALKYVNFSATTFSPRDTAITYQQSNFGCLYRTGGADSYWMDHELDLPDGAIIRSIQLSAYDNTSTAAAYAVIQALSGYEQGTYPLTVQTPIEGTPGWATIESAGTYTVNNENTRLTLRIAFYQSAGADIKICGVRVAYEYDPFHAVLLPLVEK